MQRSIRERAATDRADRLQRFLVDEAWPQIPVELRGSTITKQQREELLGLGADGV